MATILIADDDADIAALASRAVRAAGHDVILAADGAQALARAGAADLAILDVSMPLLDGWQVTEQLRAAPHTRDLPVLVLSGLTSAEDVSSALDAGADGYLTKPFVPFELKRRIEHLLATTPLERRTTWRRSVWQRHRRTA